MKKIIILFCTCVAIISCNKAITSYPSALPWTGSDPFSATVNTTSFIPATTNYFAYNPDFIISGRTDTIGVDSVLAKSFTLKLPTSTPLNQMITVDSSNTNYYISYTELLTDTLGNVRNKKMYSTTNTDRACTIRFYQNDSKIKAVFNGYLRDVLYGSSKYIEITNGYFNFTK